jgi:hypothetical protein
MRQITLGITAATAIAGCLAFGGSAPALADPYLPGLTNLNFDSYTGAAPKASFTSVDPTGWTGGSGLIFIASTSPFSASAAGPTYLQTYGNPSGSYSGNYVEADGNPNFESGFNTTVSGLTPGQTYQLSFYQGASQQVGYHGATTNQWIVSLGTAGLTVTPGSGGVDTYANADANASVVASPLMSVPSEGTVGWNYVTVTLTADAATDTLSFLAWGDNGNTTNLPPMAFLAGVDSPPGLGVPEPGSLALLGSGLIGLGFVAARKRQKPDLGVTQ